MAQPKGHKKTGGRQRGTPNRFTTDVRTWITNLVNNNRAQIEKDMQMLEPYERLRIVEKLLSYICPKLQSMETKININKLSEEQLNLLVNELLNKEETNNEN